MDTKDNKILISELVAVQKEKIDNLHLEYLQKAEQLGEQDGSLSLPRQEDNIISPNERMIKHKYQKLLADCFQKGKPYLDEPHLEYQTLQNKIDDFDKNKSSIMDEEIAILEQKKKDKLEFLGEEYHAKKAEINNHDKFIQRDYLMAKKDLQNVQQKVGRLSPIIHFKSTVAYLLLLFGIGICEVPLNLQIFQKFGEAFFITIIMASSLAIAIPVLAHFSGVFIKQRAEKKDYSMFAMICVGVFLIFNFGVSIFRAYTLAENLGQDPDLLSMVIFTCLNLILFIIGVLAAYFRHDESYELEYTYLNFQKEKKKYDNDKEKILADLKKLEAFNNKQTKEIQTIYLYEKANLNYLKAGLIEDKNTSTLVYDRLLNSFVGLEEYLHACYLAAIEKYRAVNLLYRKDHLSPTSWSNGIEPLDFKFQEMLELDPN